MDRFIGASDHRAVGRQGFVEPILRGLGWNTLTWKEVSRDSLNTRSAQHLLRGSLNSQHLAATRAGQEGFDVAAGEEAFHFAVGERGVRKRFLAGVA
jgi:hypothetical protein